MVNTQRTGNNKRRATPSVLFAGLPPQLRLILPDHGNAKSCVAAPGTATELRYVGQQCSVRPSLLSGLIYAYCSACIRTTGYRIIDFSRFVSIEPQFGK